MTTELWDAFDDLKHIFEEDSDSNEEKEEVKMQCYSCKSESLVLDESSIVCEDCGIDNGDIIDYQQEWRFYGSDDTKNSSDPTRCGMPVNPLLPEASLGTIILAGYGFENIRKVNGWNSMSYKERSLLKVFRNIQEKSNENDISNNIMERAKFMYKMLSEDTIKRGKSRKGLIGACLYYACKDKDDSRSTKEISKMFDLKSKKMTSGCKQFHEMMYYCDNKYLTKIKPTTAKNFIDRYSIILKIEKKYRETIHYVADMASKLGLVSENTPSSIAVGSIYLVSQELKLGVQKKKLAEICNISEVTISKTYKKMQPFAKFLMPMDDDE